MTTLEMKAKIHRNKQLNLLISRLNQWEQFYKLGKKSALRYAGKAEELREMARAISWRNHRRIMAHLERSPS